MRQNSILIDLFFFYFNCFPDDASELMILLSTHHMTNHLTCCNKLTRLWVVIWSWKYENTIPEISRNSILHPIMYFYLENHSIFTTDPYRLKAKNINSLIFISTIIKLLMLNIFFYFIDLVLLREKRKQLFVYWCSSPQIFCLK